MHASIYTNTHRFVHTLMYIHEYSSIFFAKSRIIIRLLHRFWSYMCVCMFTYSVPVSARLEGSSALACSSSNVVRPFVIRRMVLLKNASTWHRRMHEHGRVSGMRDD